MGVLKGPGKYRQQQAKGWALKCLATLIKPALNATQLEHALMAVTLIEVNDHDEPTA